MSKRQVRITRKLDVRLPDYLSQTIDIIGRDQRVYHLILTKVDSEHLYGINLRGKKEKLPLEMIREVILLKDA